MRKKSFCAPSLFFKILSTAVLPLLLLNSTVFADTIRLPGTGQRKCYDDWNSEVSCLNTGQDGENQAGIKWPAPRFKDNGDGTILDNLTGLIWLKDANCMATSYSGFDKDGTAGDGAVNWQHSLDFVSGINKGTYPNCGSGKTDWRLPNANELESLVNADASTTALTWLTSNGFKNIQTKLYWLSTSHAENTGTYWDIDMEYGWVVRDGPKYGHFVWPVRAGQLNSSDATYPANIWKTGQTASKAKGDDGDLKRGVAWPNPRFKDNGDGTITDNLTGLVWLKNANCIGTSYPGFDKDKTYGDGAVTFQHALDFVAGVNNGTYPNCGAGKTDWRLANRKELHSLTDYSQYNPALASGHLFTNVSLLYYWSSTSFYDTREAWIHDMGHGDIYKLFKDQDNFVLTVRNGSLSAGSMAVPVGQDVYTYPSLVQPVIDTKPAVAKPVGAGSVATGGSTLSVQIKVGGFSGAVDIYFAVSMTGLTSKLFLMTPTNGLKPLSAVGLVPWFQNVSNQIDEKPFGDISISLLPSGTYNLYLMVVPTGDLKKYYIWATTFTIP